MQVKYQTYTMHLEDLPLDLGYMSEQIILTSIEDKDFQVGGQNGNTQLLISLPFLNDTTLSEIQKIQEILPDGGEYKVETTLILARKPEQTPKLENIRYGFDTHNEFADFYSLALCGEPLDGALAKAITLISKDGALFHDEICENLTDPFDYEKLHRKIVAAQICYTGHGCH